MAKYGDRLLCTHIHDNRGITRPGDVDYRDDLHLLPFDGVKDWVDAVDRMNACGYQGELTFELNISSKPDRHENDIYAQMPFELYLAEAYKRACRLATLKMQRRK